MWGGRHWGHRDEGTAWWGLEKRRGLEGSVCLLTVLQRGGPAPCCWVTHRTGGPSGGSGWGCWGTEKATRGPEMGSDLGHPLVLLFVPGRAGISPLLSGEAPGFRTFVPTPGPYPQASHKRRAFILGKEHFSPVVLLNSADPFISNSGSVLTIKTSSIY